MGILSRISEFIGFTMFQPKTSSVINKCPKENLIYVNKYCLSFGYNLFMLRMIKHL